MAADPATVSVAVISSQRELEEIVRRVAKGELELTKLRFVGEFASLDFGSIVEKVQAAHKAAAPDGPPVKLIPCVRRERTQ